MTAADFEVAVQLFVDANRKEDNRDLHTDGTPAAALVAEASGLLLWFGAGEEE